VTQTTRHLERLTVPWTWWPPALAVVAVLGLQVGLAVAMVPSLLPIAVLVPVAAAGLWWLGRLRVAVVGDEFQVDDARLPVDVVSQVVPLDAAGRRELMGPSADPLAFVVQRPWIPGAVQVVLDDPRDPTPYWLVSTRYPDRLAAALTTAGAGRPATGGPANG
jgi:hypothetical protein